MRKLIIVIILLLPQTSYSQEFQLVCNGSHKMGNEISKWYGEYKFNTYEVNGKKFISSIVTTKERATMSRLMIHSTGINENSDYLKMTYPNLKIQKYNVSFVDSIVSYNAKFQILDDPIPTNVNYYGQFDLNDGKMFIEGSVLNIFYKINANCKGFEKLTNFIYGRKVKKSIDRNSQSFDNFKRQCEEIGFKPKTEKYGECVLKMIENDNGSRR